MDEKELELFREDGCLTDEGLQALRDGQLDELGRLEAAEHLSYCDKCMDRYTALLTADVLETPPRRVHGTIMTTIWVRLMQSTYGRVAVAGVAAVLALSLWRSGAITAMLGRGCDLKTILPSQTMSTPPQELTGKPMETAGVLPQTFRRAGKSAPGQNARRRSDPDHTQTKCNLRM